MLGSNDSLPMYRSSSSGPRLPALKLPAMSQETALSLAWAVVSVLILLGGALHCYSSSQQASLQCGMDACSLVAVSPEGVATWKFDRAALVGAEVVRLKDGYVVDPDDMSRKETRRLGYTVQVEIKEEIHSRTRKQQQMTSFDAGRRRTRKNSGLILDYISHKSDELDVSLTKRFTVLGTICLFVGGLSFVFAMLFGEWGSEPTPKKRS